MRKICLFAIIFLLFAASFCYAGFLDNILKNIDTSSSKQETDDSTVISGLKEAISIGTDKAVKEVSKIDGYLGNQAIN